MTIPAPANGYSARVRMELRVEGKSFDLAQIGRDRLIFSSPVSLPGTEGEVELRIDEHVQRGWATWEASDAARQVVPATLRMLEEVETSTTARAVADGGRGE